MRSAKGQRFFSSFFFLVFFLHTNFETIKKGTDARQQRAVAGGPGAAYLREPRPPVAGRATIAEDLRRQVGGKGGRGGFGGARPDKMPRGAGEAVSFLTDAAAAVQRARAETKLLMVFLHGDFDDEAVDAMEESVWQDAAVLAACAQTPGVVALQLNADSTGGQHFAQMYPVGATPCLQLIAPPAQQPGGQVLKTIRAAPQTGGVLSAADVAAGALSPHCSSTLCARVHVLVAGTVTRGIAEALCPVSAPLPPRNAPCQASPRLCRRWLLLRRRRLPASARKPRWRGPPRLVPFAQSS